MFGGSLPKYIEIRKLATQDSEIKGFLEVSVLRRLADSLVDDSGQISVELHFGINEDDIKVITGTLQTQVNVMCQRCLKPVSMTLQADVSLGVVWDDIEVRELTKMLDPLIVDKDAHSLQDLIEDELLLSLPFVSYHSLEECQGLASFSCGEADSRDLQSEHEKKNPFDVLKKLKDD